MSLRRLAIGDPQAPFDRFLAILRAHGALDAGGRLRDDVSLVSMGDHFDWGGPEARGAATEQGLALLSWLAAHPPDQVEILLGNHDLARVTELWAFDDETYAGARAEADTAYRRGDPDAAGERALLRRWPQLASAEVLARDYSTFCVAQRTLLVDLLRDRRVRLAAAPAPDLLLVHAGVTRADLAAAGLAAGAPLDARAAAAALNARLDAAVAAWDEGRAPLDLLPLHQPGGALLGEGRGILYHRPSDPGGEEAALFAGPPQRRFDPRALPLGLVQGVGHIRDGKCRKLLRGWADPEPEEDGPLRALLTDGTTVRYGRARLAEVPAAAIAARAAMIFLDGGMNWGIPDEYELLDLDTRRAAPRAGRAVPG